MAKKNSFGHLNEDVLRQVDEMREWDGFKVNDNNGTIHVSDSPITKLQLGAKNWIMVRSRNYWFQVKDNHLWLVKDCYKKGRSICIWARPTSKNHGMMYQLQTSGNY